MKLNHFNNKNEINPLAGIYVHIPFCKKACHYCDFHFSTSLKLKNELLESLKTEIHLQSDFGKNRTIETVYFGGGTPSILNADELNSIIETLKIHFEFSNDVEYTIECNPDDLSRNFLESIYENPFNRLSIGIQSFFDEDLKNMNRAHTSDQAHESIKLSKEIGFENITADLIFGSHSTTNAMWKKNLEILIQSEIPHISIYGLTVEPKTALDHFIKSGKLEPLDDKKYLDQFEITQKLLEKNDYIQYELSNYAKNNKVSKHNSSYWSGKEYLGLGPSSHSFYSGKRFWNISSNTKYIEAILKGSIPSQFEILTEIEKFNEYLLTSLRTIDGCQKNKIELFSKKLQDHILFALKDPLKKGEIIVKDDSFRIPRAKRIFTDRITQGLFYVD